MPWDSNIVVKDGVMWTTITEKITGETHTIRTSQGASMQVIKDKPRDMVLVDRENKSKAGRRKTEGAFEDFDAFLKEKTK